MQEHLVSCGELKWWCGLRRVSPFSTWEQRSTRGCVINAQEMWASGRTHSHICREVLPTHKPRSHRDPEHTGTSSRSGAAAWERRHSGAVLGGWKWYRKMSTFVVKDGMCWVGESQHRNRRGKSFPPANAGIEPPLSSPGLRDGVLEWSNYCSARELRLKPRQRWCLALARDFARLTGSSAQAGTAVQLRSWWRWHSWWDWCRRRRLGDVSREPAARTSASRAPPGLCLWSPWASRFESES